MKNRVFIIGHYGFGNVGDESILLSMLAHMREIRPDLAFTVASGNPAKTAANLGINTILWSDAYAMLEAVREADLVIIGGGGIFHDYWGFNPNAILTNNHWGISFFTAPVAMAAVYDKPVLLYAVGVGPLLSANARNFTKAAAEGAAAITVRDAGSLRTLQSIGIAPDRVAATADPAFGFPLRRYGKGR